MKERTKGLLGGLCGFLFMGTFWLIGFAFSEMHPHRTDIKMGHRVFHYSHDHHTMTDVRRSYDETYIRR